MSSSVTTVSTRLTPIARPRPLTMRYGAAFVILGLAAASLGPVLPGPAAQPHLTAPVVPAMLPLTERGLALNAHAPLHQGTDPDAHFTPSAALVCPARPPEEEAGGAADPTGPIVGVDRPAGPGA